VAEVLYFLVFGGIRELGWWALADDLRNWASRKEDIQEFFIEAQEFIDI
jgi:hypothetical protein